MKRAKYEESFYLDNDFEYDLKKLSDKEFELVLARVHIEMMRRFKENAQIVHNEGL